MPRKFSEIINQLPAFKEVVESRIETLIANLVMIGEIAAPTFSEEMRVSFFKQRFSECGMQDVSGDQTGNGLAVLHGENGNDRNILVVAHADTEFPDDVDHTISVDQDSIVGPGVGDNSLGLAILATLPTLMDAMQLKFQSNLVFMGDARSLGRGDLEGLRFFLENNKLSIQAGVCVEGVQLGRLSSTSIGMLRVEITCRVPEEYDWSRFGTTGAVFILNEVINRLVEIPVPRRPRTNIVLGSIRGGTSFNTVATRGVLRFEIRSESAQMVEEIRQRVDEIVAEVGSENGVPVKVDIVARRKPGGVPAVHPLVRRTRAIMKELELQPRLSPSTSELSALIDRSIPGVTVGITTGEGLNTIEERIAIAPISTGVAQLLGILLAIDRGFCDAD